MSSSGWRSRQLSECFVSVSAGVSVNSEDRPHGHGEVGVLKTSAVSGGVFKADENKTVVARDRRRVAEPVQGDSVLFSRMNTPQLVGESCFVEKDRPSLFLPDRLWQLRVEPSYVDARWMAYLLQEPRLLAKVRALATGTSGSMKNISKGSFLGLQVLLPPLNEQQRQAEILATLDEELSAIDRVVAKCDALKRALYQAFFDHARFPVVAINNVAEVRNGTTPARSRKDYWQNGRVAWLASGKVNDYTIKNPSEWVTERAVTECNLRVLPAGSVVVGMIGQGKTRGMAARLHIDASINQNLAGIVPGPQLRGDFLHHYLVHSYQKLRSGGRGSNQDALTTQLVSRFQIAFPAMEVQEQIAEALDLSDQRIAAEKKQMLKLAAIKRGLQSELLSGRVRVMREPAS